MKSLPWLKIFAGLAAFLLVYLILSMFRYEVLPSQSGLFGGSDKHAVLDRWTGSVTTYPINPITPDAPARRRGPITF